MAQIKQVNLGIQKGTSYTAFATWKWNYDSKTSEYRVLWEYDTGNGVWFIGNDSTTKYKQSTYGVPNNAIRIRFRVLPVAIKDKVKSGNKEIEKPRFTAIWSNAVGQVIDWPTPSIEAPSTPRVEITGRKLRAIVDNIPQGETPASSPTHVRFEVIKNNSLKSFKVGEVRISTGHVQYECAVEADAEYKVRAQCYRPGLFANSAWSEYSENYTVPELPAPPVPSISINGQMLKVSLSIYDAKAYYVRFDVVRDNVADEVKDKDIVIKKNYAEFTKKVAYDHEYKVRARTITKEKDQSSDWSEYSDNVEATQEQEDPMAPPSAPTVEIKNLNLKASLTIYNEKNPTHVEFEVYQNNNKKFKSGKVKINTNYAAFSCSVTAGHEYKVRARCYHSKESSAWSEWSSLTSTVPASVSKITSISAASDTSVELSWPKVANVDSYEVQYTDTKKYFDTAPDEVKSTTVESVVTKAIITGLDTGKIWYFRVRSTNSQGSGGWSAISQVRIGTTPTAPTTWSYTSTVAIGTDAVINWVHNDEDGSDQTKAEVRLTINGTSSVFTVNGTTAVYKIKTKSYSDSTIIYWEVRTKGAMPSFGPWSTKRQITVYLPASVNIGLFTSNNWLWDPFEFAVDTIYTAKGEAYAPLTNGLVEHLPIYVTITAEPSTQNVISFSVSVIANEAYDSIDELGRTIHIQKGTEVYRKFFSSIQNNRLDLVLSAGDISLESNTSYTIKAIAAMSSGLSGEASDEFNVSWASDIVEPNAEVAIDSSDMSAYIRPFCENGYVDALLSVYRREYDGTFTPIAVNLDGDDATTVVDPHPALDYARYRITALSKVNGLLSYYDIPAQEVGCTSIVIQWDEEWTNFSIDEILDAGFMSDSPHSGSMLMLPYNIDVQNDLSKDVALVSYIGRSNPVSYYGTQRGETAKWNTDIPAYDVDTLYQIRRLASYTGDVYVREPSGIGYWANITVSYKLTHTKTVVPITLDIKRVEGGM